MGTTIYFDELVRDDAGGADVQIECGTTGYAGNGPQLYLKLGEGSVILSPADAKRFCSAVAEVAGYFGYPDR